MRIPFLALTIILILNLAVDWYIFAGLKSKRPKGFLTILQGVSALILALGLVSFYFLPVRSTSDSAMVTLMWVIFTYISIYVPKYIFVIFDLLAKIPLLWKHKKIVFLSRIGCIASIVLFIAVWWGALINRFEIDIKHVDVSIEGLPKAFNGFTIVQISDLHTGTYGENDYFLSKLVKKVNMLNPDVILFTGDIVNRHTSELEPFVDVLSGLHAKYGVYSVLGNHDYGDYYNWPDSTSRAENNRHLAELQKQMGWTLLKNDFQRIVKGRDSLILIGVENIGDPPFHVYGDLQKAYPNLKDNKIKILMSHNPAHWVNDIADSDTNIALTLAGHTHAMQMSFFGWSPASMRYKTWGGLYEDKSGKHQLYVNIGTGTVGFPARIGATPEVTLITLHD